MHTTLIAAGNLANHTDDPDWVVFDCRFDLTKPGAGRAAYDAGHIRGARYADLEANLSAPKTGRNGRHPLADAGRFVEFLRTSGVNNTSQVVAYDSSGGMYAARLWWMLRWVGHAASCVLDGGLPAWFAEGLPVTTDVPDTTHGDFSIRPGLASLAQIDDVMANLKTHARLVVDARAPERYRGDVEPLDPVAGHIPSALNRPYTGNLAPNGRFKPAAQLREEFAALLGPVAAESVINQCGSGVTACHNALAMEVAGLHGAALYAGSWSEWCSESSRPMARG
jgi:thiosulfate/3-mercaptopyruvate sulfurtransferase